jgi:hypothetical protein
MTNTTLPLGTANLGSKQERRKFILISVGQTDIMTTKEKKLMYSSAAGTKDSYK